MEGLSAQFVSRHVVLPVDGGLPPRVEAVAIRNKDALIIGGPLVSSAESDSLYTVNLANLSSQRKDLIFEGEIRCNGRWSGHLHHMSDVKSAPGGFLTVAVWNTAAIDSGLPSYDELRLQMHVLSPELTFRRATPIVVSTDTHSSRSVTMPVSRTKAATYCLKSRLFVFGGVTTTRHIESYGAGMARVSPLKNSRPAFLNDTFYVSFAAGSCESVTTPTVKVCHSVTGSVPSGRAGALLSVVGSDVIVSGGTDNLLEGKTLSDMHVFKLHTHVWTRVLVSGAPMAGRACGIIVPAIDGRQLLMFGGSDRVEIVSGLESPPLDSMHLSVASDSLCVNASHVQHDQTSWGSAINPTNSTSFRTPHEPGQKGAYKYAVLSKNHLIDTAISEKLRELMSQTAAAVVGGKRHRNGEAVGADAAPSPDESTLQGYTFITLGGMEYGLMCTQILHRDTLPKLSAAIRSSAMQLLDTSPRRQRARVVRDKHVSGVADRGKHVSGAADMSTGAGSSPDPFALQLVPSCDSGAPPPGTTSPPGSYHKSKLTDVLVDGDGSLLLQRMAMMLEQFQKSQSSHLVELISKQSTAVSTTPSTHNKTVDFDIAFAALETECQKRAGAEYRLKEVAMRAELDAALLEQEHLRDTISQLRSELLTCRTALEHAEARRAAAESREAAAASRAAECEEAAATAKQELLQYHTSLAQLEAANIAVEERERVAVHTLHQTRVELQQARGELTEAQNHLARERQEKLAIQEKWQNMSSNMLKLLGKG